MLRLERAGKKASLMNKFKVFIDDRQVGELKKYGNSAEFVVTPGTHTLAIKAFGGVRGSAEVDFADGEVVDLMCGYPSFTQGLIGGMAGQDVIGFWPRES